MENETTSEGGVPLDLVNTASGEETTADSAPETQEQGDINPSQEGEENTSDESNVPFHQHPRFKEIIDQNRGYSKEIADLKEVIGKSSERSQSLEKAIAALSNTKGGELDPEYVKLMGDDEAARDYYKYMQNMVDKAIQSDRERAQREAAEREQQANKQREEWQNVLEEQFKDIESQGNKIDRDELLKFAQQYSTGGILMDLRHAHKLMTDIKGSVEQNALEEKKQNAAMVSSSNNSTPASKDKVVTLDEVHNRSWSSWKN